MAKAYQITKTINGKDYTAQFTGLGTALDAVDSTYIDGTSTTSSRKMSKFLLENVLVKPKGLTADDFDTMDEFNEVITFCREVMQGDFHNKKDESATPEKG